MKILLVGIGILGFVLFLFYLKNHVESPVISRLARSEVMMRFAVIGALMIAVGALMVIGQLFS